MLKFLFGSVDGRKRESSQIKGRLTQVGLSAALVLSLAPLSAFADPMPSTNGGLGADAQEAALSQEASNEGTNESELSLQADPTVSDGWTLCGRSAQWKFDDNGTFTVKPLEGASSGEISKDLLRYIIDKKLVMRAFVMEGKITTPQNFSVAEMFYECKRLERVDLSGFDTSNITDMRRMFFGCTGLTSLNLSSFDTSNVNTMFGMFQGCTGLTSLDLSSFDTSKVTVLSNMFQGCSNLTSLNLTSFNTSHAKTLTAMFGGCSKLASLDLSSFDMRGVASAYSMFSSCYIEEIKLGKNWLFKESSGFRDDLTDSDSTPHLVSSVTGKSLADSWTNGSSHYSTADLIDKWDGAKMAGSWTLQAADEPELAFSKIAMYRLYNPNSGEHLFTKDENEYQVLGNIGWKREGVAWYAPSVGKPVYRLYNANSGDHHYTTDANEYDALERIGWKKEGVSWNSGGDVSVYRVFNPNVTIGTHHYTTDANEYKTLGTIGWKAEGVGWYGM